MEQNLSLYNIFYVVAKNQNISHASKELFISQPAISKSIKKLEQSLDTHLFVRNSRGVALTPEGVLLYEHLKNAFESIESAEERLKQITTLGIGHIRIGVSNTLCKYILLDYLKDFINDNPHIKITIFCQSTNQTLKLLEENKIDIGLIGKPRILKDIDFYSLGEIEDIFVTSLNYLNNLKIRENSDDILSNSVIMLLDKNNMTRQYIDDYLTLNHIEVNDLIEISSMDLLIEFAKIGMGIACVIKDFVKTELQSGELIEIPLGIPIHKREIGFAYRTTSNPFPAMEKFVNFYKK